MNEEVVTGELKATLERFRAWEFDGQDAEDHRAILAHLDGEPGRLAAAREEQRELGVQVALAYLNAPYPVAQLVDHLRATPLDSTTLEDEIQALRERARVAERVIDDEQNIAVQAQRRAEKAEARVRELERNLEGLMMGGVTTETREQIARAEKAEAERDEAWKKADEWRERAQKAQGERNKAEAERDELLLLVNCTSRGRQA